MRSKTTLLFSLSLPFSLSLFKKKKSLTRSAAVGNQLLDVILGEAEAHRLERGLKGGMERKKKESGGEKVVRRGGEGGLKKKVERSVEEQRSRREISFFLFSLSPFFLSFSLSLFVACEARGGNTDLTHLEQRAVRKREKKKGEL